MDKQKALFPFLGTGVLTVVLAAIFFYLDLLLPLGYAAAVPYISLVLLGLWAGSRVVIIVNSMLGTVLTIIGAYYSPAEMDLTIGIFNRCLALATLWISTHFCLMNLHWMREKYRLDLLEEANLRLQEETGYVQLHRDIASFTNLSRSLDDVIAYSLRNICEFTGWPVGHLYLLEANGKTLHPSGIWNPGSERKIQNFINITQASRLAVGEGLPGRVVADGKAHFIMDLKADPNFPRAALSKKLDVVSGFAFPILLHNTAVGAMEFFSTRPQEPGKRLMEVMESIGILLGRAIERTRAEQERDERNNHMRQLCQELESVREEESKRMASEVQDNFAQLLTALKVEFSLLESKLSVENLDMKENLERILGIIDKKIQVVKKI